MKRKLNMRAVLASGSILTSKFEGVIFARGEFRIPPQDGSHQVCVDAPHHAPEAYSERTLLVLIRNLLD